MQHSAFLKYHGLIKFYPVEYFMLILVIWTANNLIIWSAFGYMCNLVSVKDFCSHSCCKMHSMSFLTSDRFCFRVSWHKELEATDVQCIHGASLEFSKHIVGSREVLIMWHNPVETIALKQKSLFIIKDPYTTTMCPYNILIHCSSVEVCIFRSWAYQMNGHVKSFRNIET